MLDDDPTIRLGGLADDGHEPLLVNKSPLPAMTLVPIMTIDQAIARHSESVRELLPIKAQKSVSLQNVPTLTSC
jgi:hypothetical protein